MATEIRLQDILCSCLALFFSAFIIFIFVRGTLNPRNPMFNLQRGSIYTFNQTRSPAGNFLTTTIQVSVSTKNPSIHMGIHYEKLSTHAYYRGEPIAGEIGGGGVGPTYLGVGEEIVWSPLLSAREVPVSPELSAALEQDKSAGVMLLQVKMEGRLRWRLGSWTSGGYGLSVRCRALFSVDGVGEDSGEGVGSSILIFRKPSDCLVHV